MRKCTACGNELATYAVYCTKCGKINPITPLQSRDEDKTKEKSDRDTKKQHDPIQFKSYEPTEQKSYTRFDDAKRDAVIKTDSNIHTDSTIGYAKAEKGYPRLDDAKRDSVIKTDSSIHTDSTIGHPSKSHEAIRPDSPPPKQVIGSVSGTYASSSVKSDSIDKSGAQPQIVQPSSSDSGSTTSRTPDNLYHAPDGVRVSDEAKFIARFSFAPGCVFYLFSRALGAFLLVNLSLFFIYAFFLPDNGSSNKAATDLLTKIYFLLQVPVLLWMGSVARKRRWKMLKFQSFNHFKSDEVVWGLLGGIGWFTIVLMALFVLFD